MPHLQVSQIYQKTWNAIHAKNEDGTRKYRYIIHKGSSRSSKTYSLIDCYDTYARSEDNKRMTVWRNTKVDCKKTVLNDTIKHLKKTGRYGVAQIFNKTESIFTYATDSTFEIHGTEDVDTVMGLTQDVAWLNEPYQISREIFDQIDQRTSDFILVDLNPKKAHWVDDLEKDSRAIVIHSTFRDNPFVPIEQKIKILSYQPISWCDLVIKGLLKEDEARNYSIEKNELDFTPKQLRELDRCRENEYKNSADSYNWCVFGLGLKAERPNRIFKFNVIPDQQFFDLDVTTYYGVDWGASHPWAVIAVKYYDGALYLHELNYTPENVIRAKLTPTEREQIQTGEEGLVMYYFKKFGIAKGATIVCDPNRKEKIAALRTIGYTNAVPAAKPPGSVNFGIDTIKNIPVFFTKSSTNIDFEQENYSYIVDSYGVTTEDPEDLDNHCFVGETIINTKIGELPIMEIKTGDFVLTSNGYKKVLIKWNNGLKVVNKYLMQFDTFSVTLTCTANHLIKTNKGWIQISKLESGMMVTHIKHSMIGLINYIQEKDTLAKVETECTSKFMSFIMAKYQKGFTFITSMKISGIIDRIILNLKKVVCTFQSILNKDLKITLNGLKTFNLKALQLPQNGMHQKPELNGINNTQTIIISEVLNSDFTNAKYAIQNMSETQKNKSFAQTNVNLNFAGVQELMTYKENVLFAKSNSSSVNIQKSKCVAKSVLESIEVISTSRQEVYDLTVSGDHEYFANGILVHNCMDALRYVVSQLRRLGIIKKI